MSLCQHTHSHYSRRDFLTRGSLGLGAAALSMLSNPLAARSSLSPNGSLPAKAKRVIYLFQSGAPSQLDLFDYKPTLQKMHGQELPESVRGGQRLTGMSAGQSSLPLVGTPFSFSSHGQSGMEISELLPHTAKVVDDLCLVKSMYTEAINHDPAVTFLLSGSQFPGRPSMGAWLSYGMGSENDNLPSFVVLTTKDKTGQPLYSRSWGNGFLPSEHQGVQFRSGKNPVLYLENPPGVTPESRRAQLDRLQDLQQEQYASTGDPEIKARMAQYEMAFRMQTSVPEVMDVSNEPDHIYDLYGEDSRKPGTFAANCLLARRLAEKGVRFIQLFHQGWDQHGNLPRAIKVQCKETDQASAALIHDLKQRGMLDDTLVIWGGEFGRTNYSQGRLTASNFGRDHHPGCFSLWMAGGGVN
ncbi:MAG: DUF1501 domain-containing protein, partial [Saprospiraceae bacterium]|nr:DUF1501 domain-containing protein [Saprospiraceae bacterium]